MNWKGHEGQDSTKNFKSLFLFIQCSITTSLRVVCYIQIYLLCFIHFHIVISFWNFFIQFTHTHITYYLPHYITRKNRHSIFCLVDFYPHVFVPIHIHWAFNVKNSWLHDLLNQKLCFSNEQKKNWFFFLPEIFQRERSCNYHSRIFIAVIMVTGKSTFQISNMI